MMKLNKIGLFLPRVNHFYQELFESISDGFKQVGIEVIGACELLDVEQLNQFCKKNNLQVIFEMNRSRAQIEELSKNIIHIAWIVDPQGKSVNYCQDSDIIYFFNSEWCQQYISNKGHCYGWLAPGFDEKKYPLLKTQKLTSDFSFAGHIPNPWDQAELSRCISKDNNILFSDLEKEIDAFIELNGGWHRLHVLEYRRFLNELIKKYTGKDYIEDPTLRYDLEVRITRTYGRKGAIDIAMSISDSIKIYGPDNWQRWECYKDKYQGYLDSYELVNKACQSAKLNIHDGVGLHFRSINCMGSGALLFYLYKPMNNETKGALWDHFDVDRDFVLFDCENASDFDKTRRILQDRKSIGFEPERVREFVINNHSWKKRAEQILSDINRI